jgi:filamentous hemagglutinin family protein
MSPNLRNRHKGSAAETDPRAPATGSEVRVIGLRRCSKSALLGGTALRAAALVVLATPANAQLAAGAHPTGGAVVGGSASITQSGNTTDITQKSGRAAIDWQSFNVGSAARVVFAQPSSSSVVLNTVVGPNPSEIAGRITANGVVAIVNQSGVIFDQGSQVDTAGLVVSAAGITRQNFMSGHMVFDQAPHPGARVVNNGAITIKQAGLAALVAPQVVNNGMITAKLGRVILGGATTYTLDLYGDGLLALNVTGQVTKVTLGGRTMPALVTNAGTIIADGGTVVLNASAADGLIRTLIESGGSISASSVGPQSGRVLVQGIGGSVDIAGAVSATGAAPGTRGGTIVANATGTVSLASTARIDASGATGGGLVAIGTTAARAASRSAHATLTAQAVNVAAGATLAANATGKGDGGDVTLLATGNSSLGGAISVLGGAAGGNGGLAEISGETVALTGIVDSRAPLGRIGSMLIDPAEIVVSDVSPDPAHIGGFTWISDTSLSASTTGITLSATGNIAFAYQHGKTNTVSNGTAGQIFSVISIGGNINVDAGFTLTSVGSLTISAAKILAFDSNTGSNAFGFGAASATSSVLKGPVVSLTGTTGVQLAGASITGSTSLALTAASGAISGAGVITTPSLTATASTGISLTGANAITATGAIDDTTSGNIVIDNAGTLLIGGALTSAGNVTLSTGALTINGTITTAALGTASITVNSGTLTEQSATTPGDFTGAIVAGVLTGSVAAGSADLRGNNAFGALGAFSTGGAGNLLFLYDNGPVDVTGVVSAGGALALDSLGTGSKITVALAGSLAASGGAPIQLGADAFALTGGVTTTGVVAFGRASSGALNLGGTADSFGLLGVGSVSAGTLVLGSISGSTPDFNTTSLGISQSVGSSGLTLALYSSGGISEAALAGITAKLLEGSASGDVSLGGVNAVTTLGGFTTTGSLAVTNAQSLLTTGAQSASTGLSLTVTGLGHTLGLGSTLSGTSVTLSSPGAIDQTAGKISATDLAAVSSAGSIGLGLGANAFGTITTINAATTATLNDGQGFAIAGPVNGTSVSLTSAGTISQGTGGVITATSLTGSAAAAVALTATNEIGTLGAFTTSSGGFSLVDGGSLAVNGLVHADVGGTAASPLLLEAPTLTVTGTGSLLFTGGVISLGTDTLTLTGGVSTGAGTGLVGIDRLTTGTLSIGASGLPTVSTGTLAIGSLDGTATGHLTAIHITGALSVPDTLALFTSGSLTAVAGLSAGTLTGHVGSAAFAGTDSIGTLKNFTVDSGGLTLVDSGSLIIAGTVVATGAAITLDATGDITELTGGVLAGALTATSLTGSASGSIDLGDSANAIGSIASLVATAGPLVLADASTLHIDGIVTSGAGLTLSVTGSGNALALDAAAALTATGSLSLTAAGALTEDPAATLSATTLTGSAGGSVALIGSNLVGTLGPLSSGAGLTLDDGRALSVTGSVSAVGALAITVSTGTLSVGTSGAGDGITGASVALDSAGKLTQFAGGAITGTSGNVSLTSDTAGIAFGGTLAAAAGAVQFAALSGTVTETDGTTAGAVNAVSVTGTAHAIALTGTNAAATLTNLDATAGNLTIDEAPASAAPTVTVAGVLSSTGTLALTLSGSTSALSLGGALSAPTVALTAPAGIGQTSGGITATTLTAGSSGGGIALTSTANQVGTLGASSAAAGFALTDSGTSAGLYHGTLTETGPVTVGSLSTLALRAPTLTITGSLVAPGGTIALGTDTLTLTGNVTTNAGTGVVGIDTFSGSTLTIGAGDFASVSTGILALGSLNGVTASGRVTDIEITGGALALGSNTPTLGLFTTATGTVNATAGIAVGTLIGNAGTVSITGANSIDTLGNFTAAGGLSFVQSGNLSLAGAVNGDPSANISLTGATATLTLGGGVAASATTLSAGNLQIPGTATGTTTLVLIATNGTITETGTLNTALLSGSAFGTAALTGSNSVTSVGNFTADGFALTDGQNLSVTGLVTGGAGGIALDSTGSANLDISGSLTTSAAITLSAGGTIGEAGGGMTADTLTGSAGTVANLSGTNDVGTLSAFSATSLTLHDGATLSVAGPVISPVTTLQANAIDITGSIDAAASLALTATAGRITEEGSITAGSLTGTTTTHSAGFTGVNHVTDLGDFVANGFTFDQTSALNVTGNVQAGPTAIFSIGGSLGVASTGTIGATSVSLTAASIAATGVVSATTLTGVITGDANLAGANTLTNVGDFSAATLELHDSTGLTLTGNIDAPTSVDLTVAGTIGQTGGGVTTTLLAASGTGAIDLESTGNAVGTLGAVTVTQVGTTGGLTFAQTGSLTVAGPVDGGLSTSIASTGGALSVSGSVTGSSTSLNGSAIAISGSVTGTQSLALTASGSITESGALTAGTLTGSAGTSADLSGTNSVGDLGAFTAEGFTLKNSENLAVSGLVSGGAGGIDLITTGAANLDIGGSLTTSAAITLSAAGTIGEAGGGLSANTLTGSAGTVANLSGTNDVGTLGAFSATSLTLHDGATLSVAGPVTSPATTLQANAIDITGSIDAATALSLTSIDGRITEEGSITTGSLTGSSGTFATGFAGTNIVTDLGNFVADGFNFHQTPALNVTGNVQAGTSAIFSIGGSLGVASTGTIAATSVSVTAASIAELGAISATTLGGVITGDAHLTGANTLTGVGNFSAATIELDNSTGLALNGSLTGTQSIGLTLTAGTLTVADVGTVTGSVTTLKAGAIDLAGIIRAATSADLISAGIIDQTAGGITTTLLQATGAGSIGLASASNAVGTLGGVTVTPVGTTGGLIFGQSGGLTVAGPVDGGLSTSITSSSGLLGVTGSVTGTSTALSGTSIAIGGSVTGTQLLALSASGSMTESGALTAGMLTGSAGTSADFAGANDVGHLGAFSAASFTLLDAGAPTLTTIGAVAITGALSVTAPNLALGGNVTAGSAFLSATAGTIAGAIGVTGSLTGTSTASTDLTGEIASLGSFTAAGFALTDTRALQVGGPLSGGSNTTIYSAGALTVGGPIGATNVSLTGLSISISATGSVTASGLILSAFGDTTPGDGTIVENAAGGITAGILSGSAQGSASLVGVNSIGTLTAFSAAPLTLHDASALTIGSVTGSYTPSGGAAVFGSVALDLPGQALTITGTLNATGEPVSIAAGSVAETGSIIAASLSGTTSGATSLTSNFNAISALGSYTAAGFALDDNVTLLSVNGPVTGGASVSISNRGTGLAAGNLDVAGAVTATDIALHADQQMTITGTAVLTATNVTLTAGTGANTGSLSEDSTASIDATTLTGNVQGAALLVGANTITNLGSFTATGGLTLDDTAPLTILGPIDSGPLLSISTPGPLTIGSATGSGTVLSGTAIALSAGNITIDGIIDATTSLSLTATDASTAGTIGEIATTALQTPLLTLSAPGDVALLGTANLIASTGAVTVGNLQLVDAEDISVAGALVSSNGATITDAGHAVIVDGNIQASDTTLTAGDIAVPGVIATGTLELVASATGTATGTVSAPGTIIAGGVSGSATGSASLVSATDSNQIQTLGGFGAAGFALNDSTALTVTGAVNGEASTSITADGLLTVAGSVAGATTTLTGDGIVITGAVTATDLSLFSGGNITGTGSASVTATSLTGSAAAAVLLTGVNTITTLGSFTTDGFSLADTGQLTIAGPLQGGPGVAIDDAMGLTITGTVAGSSTSLTATSLTVSGTVSATTLDLSIGGTLTETGIIDTTLLEGSVTGSAAFGGTNAIGTLGAFTAGGLTFDDTTDIVIAGPVVSAATTLTAAAIDIPGMLTVTDLVVSTPGTIAEGGTLTVSGTLSGSTGGSAAFTGSNSNSIATIAGFASAGLTLDDQQALVVGGAVDGNGSASITDAGLITVQGVLTGAATSLTAAALDVPGSITAAGSLALSISGTIAEGGSIATPLLTGSATGSAVFSGTNAIDAIGPFTAAGLVVNDAPDLTIAGPVNGNASVAITDQGTLSVGSSLTGASTSLTAAAIDIPGSVSATTLALTSTAGGMTETGSIAAGTLTGTAATGASLTGSNSIGTLGDFTAATGLTLDNTPDLNVTGAIAGGPSVTITDAGVLTVTGSIAGSATALTGSSIDIMDPPQTPGAITASDSLILTATSGTISETGSITTALLSGSATGDATLTGTNAITNLGDFTGANLALADAQALTVTGSVTAATIALTTASLTVNGTLDAPGQLQVTTGAFSSTGTIITGLLTGSATGGASLTGTDLISTLGSFAASPFTLIDNTALTVTGPVLATASLTITDSSGLIISGQITGALTTLTATTIDLPGSLAASDTLSLTATGAITQGGSIAAGLLDLSAGGTATLTGSNSIGTLGSVTAAGLALDNTIALTVAGTVNGQGSLTLTDYAALTVAGSGSLSGSVMVLNAAGMTIDGAIDAGTSLNLLTPGSIGETGSVATAHLTGSAGGSADFAGTNQILAVGDFTAGSSFALRDASDLSLDGVLNATSGNITLTAADITQQSGATTGTGILSDTATIGTISLAAAGTVALDGLIDAPTILIGGTVLTPAEVIMSGNTIITGSSVPPGSHNPAFPPANGTRPGIFILTDKFAQTGTTRINPNNRASVIEISLARRNGMVTFDQSYSAGLIAPRSELFMNLNFGTASGHIEVAGLNLSYVLPGSTSLTDLFGTINNETGPAAAGAAYIKQPNSDYRFNACPIQSINCILVSPVIVPVTNPVEDVEVTTPRRRRDDDDLIIPNVGEQDF